MASEAELGQLTIDVKLQKEIANHPRLFIVIKKDYQREMDKVTPFVIGGKVCSSDSKTFGLILEASFCPEDPCPELELLPSPTDCTDIASLHVRGMKISYHLEHSSYLEHHHSK